MDRAHRVAVCDLPKKESSHRSLFLRIMCFAAAVSAALRAQPLFLAAVFPESVVYIVTALSTVTEALLVRVKQNFHRRLFHPC